ncbi:MAG TPA: protein kinase [Terracidiphilus sp.]|jgi:serine/threonine-protein kinase|nr:protein kinase [Terracidiphilus sp.]
MADTGQRVGDYEVLAPLGAGGMGRVFKVRNVISDREEAMKILLPDFAADPDLAARFMAEIRTLAGLDHPGIAQLHTAFQYNNQFVMVMEFVEGTTLEKLAAQARIPLDQVLEYATQALGALSYAHGRGVIHRDIKPANIMITSHGVVKLMDFGIAKSTNDMNLTRPGTTMGSVYYMSPEQVRGGTIDARSDIYSFGVTLYEMLTGRKPFQADSSYTVLNAQLNQAPTPPFEVNSAISPELNNIVLRALAKLPEERFQTAEEFRSALKALREPLTAQIAQAAAPPQYQGQQYADAAQPSYASPQPPAFQPVPTPPGPPPSSRTGHRGLWIGLGAATAILALVAVAWVLPRVLSTHASPNPAAADTSTPAPPSTPASTPQPPASSPEVSTQQTSPAATGSPQTPEPPAVKPPAARPATHAQVQPTTPAANAPRQQYVSPTASSAPTSASSEAAVPAGPSPKEVRDAHDRYANLQARSDSALAGVEQIRSQQQAQGLDIRGDILTAMNRLHHQLNEAQRALDGRDIATANDYMNRADNDVEKLEKFLGR